MPHSVHAEERRISTFGMERGAGGRDGRGMVAGGVRHRGQDDGGRVADRRLLYHPQFQFNLLSDLPRNMPG